MILTGRPKRELIEMSIPQLKALERAALRIRASDGLEQLAVLNAALAGAFGLEGSAKEFVEKLRELATTGRP